MEDDESLGKGSFISTPHILLSRQRSKSLTSTHPSHLNKQLVTKTKSLSSSVSAGLNNTKDNDSQRNPDPDDESLKGSEKKKTRKYSTYQKWVLLSISLICFTSYLLMAILAPFFPSEAAKKGMTQTLSGLTFSVYALIIMISSPIFGKILPIVKAKPMLLVGVFISGSANIAFGLLDRVNSNSWFTASALIIRSLEGFGAAAFSTASYTYIMHTFPDDVSGAFGLTETFIGIGETIGPAVGGGLYALGGYGLPFFVLGSFVLLTIPFCFFILKPIEDCPTSDGQSSGRSCTTDIESSVNSTKSSSSSSISPSNLSLSESPGKDYVESTYWNLIRIPEILIVSLVVVIISQSQAFLEPTIEPHLTSDTFGLDTKYVSFVFLLMAVAYAITSPLTGWAASRINKMLLMISGLLISSCGLLLLGPSYVIGIDGNITTAIISMLIMGISYAIAFIPSFEALLDVALDNGLGDNVTTYSLISGLWGAMFSLGEVTGPVLGGFLVDQFNFKIASTIMSLLSVMAALACILTSILRKIKSDRRHRQHQKDGKTNDLLSSKSYGSITQTIFIS